MGKPGILYGSLATDGSTVYVSGPNVTVIDGSTDKIDGSLWTPGGSDAIAMDSGSGTLYANNASCTGSCNVTINRLSGEVQHPTISVGGFVNGIAVNPRTGMVYASSPGYPDSLFVISGGTGMVVANVSLPDTQNGMRPAAVGVALNQITNVVYVSVCYESIAGCQAEVFALNGTTDSIIAQVPIPGTGTPSAMAVDPITRTVYFMVQSQLISINGTSYAENAEDVSALHLNCPAIAVDDATGDIYIACSPDGNLPSFIILNGNEGIIDTFSQKGSPVALVLADGVYVAYQQGYVLSLLWTPPTLPP